VARRWEAQVAQESAPALEVARRGLGGCDRAGGEGVGAGACSRVAGGCGCGLLWRGRHRAFVAAADLSEAVGARLVWTGRTIAGGRQIGLIRGRGQRFIASNVAGRCRIGCRGGCDGLIWLIDIALIGAGGLVVLRRVRGALTDRFGSRVRATSVTGRQQCACGVLDHLAQARLTTTRCLPVLPDVRSCADIIDDLVRFDDG
jgi:hypothetical protein